MKALLQQHLFIATHLCILAIVVCIGVFTSTVSRSQLVSLLEEHINQYEKNLLTIVEITDSNAADSETLSIISDCPRRAEYERYLTRLGSLTKLELVTLQNLFESCAPFYVEQKALMVSKLEREFRVYTEYLALLDEVSEHTEYDKTHALFKKIVMLEKERSTLLKDQTELQQQIITLLISGKSPQGADVAKLVENAQQIAELLAVLDTQVDEAKTQISL